MHLEHSSRHEQAASRHDIEKNTDHTFIKQRHFKTKQTFEANEKCINKILLLKRNLRYLIA